jgi:hypothetical protein
MNTDAANKIPIITDSDICRAELDMSLEYGLVL